jgi:ABC-2 type transport system ATP-binding protein
MEQRMRGAGASDDVVIEATGLRRRYRGDGAGFEAVAGVDLRVTRGETFALLGTNGAGKTSTVELLEGLAAPSGGVVRIFGLDPFTRRGAVRPRVGVMLQAGGFAKDLTVAETCTMWAGCTPGAGPVGELLDLVGLDARRDVRVKQLSGGESRRLDLALALLGRPEVLFLDEPTTGMDPEGRHATWRIVRGLREAGTTILLTTHYLEEAEELADRLAILRHGRVVAEGTPAEVAAAFPSTVSFDLPDGWSAHDLPVLPDVTGTDTSGRRVRLMTDRLQETLTVLLAWAQEHDVRMERLNARSASLEEAFLAITSGAGNPSGAPNGADAPKAPGPMTGRAL